MLKKSVDVYKRRTPWCFKAEDVPLSFFESVDSTLALKMRMLLRNKQYSDFLSVSVDPSTYLDAHAFREDWLMAESFSKFPGFKTGIRKDEVAIQRFAESEEQCRKTNIRLRSFFELALDRTDSIESVIFHARRKIERLLGRFRWCKAEPYFDFGPGASASIPRSRRQPFYKFSGIPEATRECAGAGELLVRSIPGWHCHLSHLLWAHTPNDSVINIVEGNRITTVPKNAKTDRTIAIEPLLNGVLQKGVGSLIRSRLRRVGIDLNDQRPNQVLCREGSITDAFATIDLKNASDSVSTELVRLLLPPDWFDAMDLIRSHRGVLPSGGVVHYQKFSSMGNGFTFELESLIFWGLCAGLAELQREDNRFLVYGDDLVVPAGMSSRLIDVLSYCGFATNKEKTFVHGPFRESCGKHYFRGTDVTPFYFRKEVDISSLTLWCNNIRRWSASRAFGLDSTLREAYRLAVSMLPTSLRRPRICDGYGDSALFGDFDEVCPKKAPRGFEGWVCHVRLPVSGFRRADGLPKLLSNLLGKEVRRNDNSYGLNWIDSMRVTRLRAPEGSIPEGERYERCEVLVPQWVDRGPWL